MKKWKNFKNYSFFILIAVSTVLFTTIGYIGKSSVYADYAVKLTKTPQLAVVFQGLSEGNYPWTKAESNEAVETIAHDTDDLLMASNDPSDNDIVTTNDLNSDTSNSEIKDIVDDSSSHANTGNESSSSQSSDNNNTTSNNTNQDSSQSDVINVDSNNQDSNEVSPSTAFPDDEESDIENKDDDTSAGDNIGTDNNTPANEQTDPNSTDSNTVSNIDNNTVSGTTNTTSNQDNNQDNEVVSTNNESNDLTPNPNSDVGSNGSDKTTTASVSSLNGSATIKTIFRTVKKSYFNDALFIGDSRTVGLCEYSYLSNATYFSDVGLNIYAVFDKKIAKIGRSKYTIDVALTKKQFKKIYIMLGINELGTGTAKSFTTEYHKVIKKIQKLQPGAIIVIQGIMNVGKAKSDKDPIFNNKRIKERNKSLSSLADNKKIFYIDVNEVITDKNGYLPSSYSFDGIHLKAKYYNVWADFLKTHGIVLDKK